MQTVNFPNMHAVAAIRHAVFTRRGGRSRGVYRSLNVAHGIGDSRIAVQENRRLIARYLKTKKLATADQVHGTNALVLGTMPGSTQNDRCFSAGSGDALLTNVPGVYLVIQTADCQPVMMVDPKRKVIANVHVGWRGNVQNMLGSAVLKMGSVYGCRPGDLQVAIGPSLGPCCAEFVNYRREFPRSMWSYRDDRHRFDLWQVSSDQLQAAGVPQDNIHVSRICTKCRTDLFYSYRAQSVTGRFASVIGLRQS